MLSEIESGQVTQELQKARLLFAIGKGNVLPTFEKALISYQELLKIQIGNNTFFDKLIECHQQMLQFDKAADQSRVLNCR